MGSTESHAYKFNIQHQQIQRPAPQANLYYKRCKDKGRASSELLLDKYSLKIRIAVVS